MLWLICVSGLVKSHKNILNAKKFLLVVKIEVKVNFVIATVDKDLKGRINEHIHVV